jgi:hypothetical protein
MLQKTALWFATTFIIFNSTIGFLQYFVYVWHYYWAWFMNYLIFWLN